MKTPKEMLDHLAEFAKKTFANEGQVLPMWVLVARVPERQIVPILAPFSCKEEKDAAVHFVREKAKEINADLVGFMAEAWTVSVQKDTYVKGSIVPSEHEDRREVINIYSEDKSGHTLAGFFYILRPEHGKPKLSPFKSLGDDAGMAGRFANILERA